MFFELITLHNSLPTISPLAQSSRFIHFDWNVHNKCTCHTLSSETCTAPECISVGHVTKSNTYHSRRTFHIATKHPLSFLSVRSQFCVPTKIKNSWWSGDLVMTDFGLVYIFEITKKGLLLRRKASQWIGLLRHFSHCETAAKMQVRVRTLFRALRRLDWISFPMDYKILNALDCVHVIHERNLESETFYALSYISLLNILTKEEKIEDKYIFSFFLISPMSFLFQSDQNSSLGHLFREKIRSMNPYVP